MALKIKRSQDFRYYLYVSDTKVDMLFEQMFAAAKRKSHIELAVKAGIANGSIGSSAEDPEPDRDDKVRAVEAQLLENGLVGTPQNPKEYIKGILPMRWGMYDDLQSRPTGSAPLVYFGGFDPTEPVVIGLGGSSVHVLGHYGATNTHSRSATPTLVRWILSGLYNEDAVDDLHDRMRNGVGTDLYEAICIALKYLKPPTQQLEFLAKTISVGKVYGDLKHMTGLDETSVVLGSPLYVQQSRHIPDYADAAFGLDDEWKEHLERFAHEKSQRN